MKELSVCSSVQSGPEKLRFVIGESLAENLIKFPREMPANQPVGFSTEEYNDYTGAENIPGYPADTLSNIEDRG